jgi:3D (Asp-Asp-Asp) domain-containing protein
VAPTARGVRVRDLWAGLGRQVALTCLIASLPLLLVSSLVAATSAGGLPLVRTVHISAGAESVSFITLSRTVGEAVLASRIPLSAGDRVAPPPDTPLWQDIQISVVRAIPITLTIDGITRGERAAAHTVGGALRVLGITTGPLDRVYPDPASPLAAGLRITVERRAWRTWVERRPIPFGSRLVPDRELFAGNSLVRSPGQEGVESRMVRVQFADDRPVALEPLAWAVVQPPVPQIVAVGTRAVLESHGVVFAREFMVLEATAYYPGPRNYGGGVGARTATGMLAQRGVVAVDPSVIPLGTRVYVEGYGDAIAADTGGAIRGKRIDLCFNTYEEAIQFGRRQVTVYIFGRI